MIIAMMGLPGSGKTTIAKELAKDLPALILNKDSIRAALFPASEIEYSSSQDDFVVNIMMQIADFYIKKDVKRHIILDGRPFSHKYQVDALVDFAVEHDWKLKVIYCYCADEISQARILHDFATEGHLAQNRDLSLYKRMRDEEDPLEIPHLKVDTAIPLKQCVNQCLKYLNIPTHL